MTDGITRIAVEGFKSIAKRQEIEIAPLTILAGANSSGKSSIMQPLLMLKQTLEAQYDPGPLKIDGPNVRFTSVDQFLSRGADALRIEVATTDLGLEMEFVKQAESGIELAKQTHLKMGSELTLCPDMPTQQLQTALRKFEPTREISHHEFSVDRNRFFLNLKSASSAVTFEYLNTYIQDVIHVPALRGTTSRTYPSAAVARTFPGTFDSYAASVIYAWQREKSSRYEDLINDFTHVKLAENLLVQRLNDVEMQVLVNRAEERPYDMVNIADVGFGVSQVLPVLTAMRAANSGQLVYLEEPEVDLHPRAQVGLAEILANAAKRGARVVAETHSTLLLTTIQTLVAKGDLNRELVKFHWFQRDQETGVTTVSSTGLDENGAFAESNWPEDFDDVILKAEGAYLDAVEERKVR